MLKLKKSNLSGEVLVPPSKSILHREIIAGCLCEENSTIKNISNISQDIEATIDALTTLGANIEYKENNIYCSAGNIFKKTKDVKIDCKESGTTLRILREFQRIYKGKIDFSGKETLLSRPKIDYIERENEIFIDCNVSSQTLSGLLMFLPLTGNKYIINADNLSSKQYIDLTIHTLERHGIYTKNKEYKNFVCYPSEYKAKETEIEADFSQSANFLVANALGAKINLKNLNLLSKQGDKKILEILNFSPNIINASDIPDIVPALSVWACFRPERTIITNIARLRHKESNRIEGILELNKLGANIIEEENRITIEGCGENFNFKGEKVTALNDHRIAMMFAICSQRLEGEIIIDNEDCVKKSYPTFWQDFKKLGGKAEINS